jgi:hypothetical protein
LSVAIQQSLLDREGGRGKRAETIKTVRGGYPDIAFTIFEDVDNVIAREAVRHVKPIGPSLVYVKYTLGRGSNPEAAVTIVKQPSGLEQLYRTRERVGLNLAVNQLSESVS